MNRLKRLFLLLFGRYLSFDRRFELEDGLDDFEMENVCGYPDFADAYISYAVWKTSGRELTDGELDALNDDSSFVYECAMEWVF